MTREPGHARAGFSLVEVVVAMGLVASVLVSIAGVFVVGSRQVRSGRSSSEALAVARDILEHIESWSYHGIPSRLGCQDTAVECEVLSSDAGVASVWQERLDRTLEDAGATITCQGLAANGQPAPLGTAHSLRFAVHVQWAEGPRERRIELVSVRM
jgi:type II secretory pathway pseudopilin PulG